MTRRHWLGSLLLPLTVPPLAAQQARRIKVTGLETIKLRVSGGRAGDWLLVRLRTDSGLVGVGEASHSGDDDETQRLATRFFDAYRGRPLFDIEWLRVQAEKAVTPWSRAAACALSGIEQALWDLQGKALGLPCYELFGGALDRRIRNYANINRSTRPRTPEGFAAMASRAVQAGFDAIKLAPFDGMPREGPAAAIDGAIDRALDALKAVREVLGPRGDLLTDVHSNVTVERGLKLLDETAPLKLFWIEEVPIGRGVEDSAAITRAANIPHAGGESIYGVAGFLPYVAAKAWDIMMPDVKYCGGMLELKKIAALSEAAGLPVSPHGPASPVGNFAAAHVSAAIPNFSILEFAFGEVDWRAELIDPPERLDKGYLELSERPGLGIELNEKTVARHRIS